MAVIEANQALKRKVPPTKYDEQKASIPNGKGNDYKLRSLSMEAFQTEFVNSNPPSDSRQVIFVIHFTYSKFIKSN